MKRFVVFIVLIALFILNYFNTSSGIDDVLDRCNISYIYENGVFKIEDFEDVLSKLRCQIIDKKYVSDRLVIEGYSGLIRDFVVINGNKVNIQISVSDNIVLMGCPLINSSF